MIPACTVPLPASIRVAAFDFAVVPWHPMSSAASRRYGEFSAMEGVIRVDPQAGNVKTCDTLLHEIGHAIWWAYNIQDEDKEERVVATTATAWTQILRDNPDLLRFINETLHPTP